MSGDGDDGFFSTEIVLLIVGVAALLLVVQFGLASIGEWRGHLIAG
ncbi:MAG: hypothetical protein ACR2H0_06495 [Candidatus Limnocylindrales bacterium]